ncbi:hypothetical protein EV360DRAFT_12016, partial [Lentinula raphanica]
QTSAERNMELIRSKRRTIASRSFPFPGQVRKNRYQKGTRATPSGPCHSCNIRESPKWRRGPDGAKTLCDRCG